jgi:hypothetical protein
MFRSRPDGTLREFSAETLAPPRFGIFSAVLPIYHRFRVKSL